MVLSGAKITLLKAKIWARYVFNTKTHKAMVSVEESSVARKRVCNIIGPCMFLLNVGLTRTRVPTATPEDDRGEKAEPRRYALLTLIRLLLFNVGLYGDRTYTRPGGLARGRA